jgi:endonuclease YncB( thermonuclease family)
VPVAIAWGIGKRPPPVNVLAPLESRSFRVVDGDTLALNIRLANVDSPEVRGKCEAEKQLAKLATDFTRHFLAERPVMITTEGVGKYGRVIAKVESLIRLDDPDLGMRW